MVDLTVELNLLDLILILNIPLAVAMVFFERRNPTSALAWLVVLLFLPAAGFVLYMVFGQNYHKARLFRVKEEDDRILLSMLREQEKELLDRGHSFEDPGLDRFRGLVFMLLENNHAYLTRDNTVQVYTTGEEKFRDLFAAIGSAQDHIHLEYYIIRDDTLGREIVKALSERARAGVTVRFLYDAVGCGNISRHFFDELRESGGQVASFFPSLIPHVNLRVNYRNHRKIAVIDGKTGFIGGFNIGDEYLGKGELGNWRDTHLRIAGSSVLALQLRFMLDWNYAASDDLGLEERYFPYSKPVGATAVQIASSGPDAKWNQIKEGYLKIIGLARESIFIQSPYFVPDESVMDAIRIAALSGIDVRIMTPAKPDHPFVHWASSSYIGDLLEAGGRAYNYESGFIHSKTIVVDRVVASVGSANWDVRSFRLNFEANAFLYDREVADRLARAFEEDIRESTEITRDVYARRGVRVKFKESVSRLLSPIL
ncbi:MAG: cardiolipin synthase [Methanoregulaceae archaeon]|nr:cardiolipin synthase [Methanoregulaceae archaeon]